MRTLALRLAIAALLLAALTGCRKDPQAARAAWNAAVARKDGAAAWGLLDRSTRAHIRDGLARSQAKAAADPAFGALFNALCAPVDAKQPPDQLAQALLGDPAQTLPEASPLPAWRPVPAGYCTPEGLPLTLTLLTGPPPAGGSTQYRLEIPVDGMTAKAVREAYARDTQALGARLGWPPALAAQAGRLAGAYSDQLIARQAFGFAILLEGDGSATGLFQAYNPAHFRSETRPEPRLAFRPWP